MPIDNSYISPGIGRIFYSHRKPYQLQKIDVTPESLNLFNIFSSTESEITDTDKEELKLWLKFNIIDKFKYYKEFLNLNLNRNIKDGFLNIRRVDRKRFLFMLAKHFGLL